MEFENSKTRETEPLMKGHLYVISGFTAAGKDTLIKELVSRDVNNHQLISFTSRPIRTSETDSLEYLFINNDQFEEMLLNDEFLQYIKTDSGDYYGTRKQDLVSSMQNGNTFWNITINTASKLEEIIRASFEAPIAEDILSRTTKILMDVPRLTVSKDRARQRESMPNDVLLSRLRKQYASYVAHRNEFDVCVVNEDLEKTIEALNRIIVS